MNNIVQDEAYTLPEKIKAFESTLQLCEQWLDLSNSYRGELRLISSIAESYRPGVLLVLPASDRNKLEGQASLTNVVLDCLQRTDYLPRELDWAQVSPHSDQMQSMLFVDQKPTINVAAYAEENSWNVIVQQDSLARWGACGMVAAVPANLVEDPKQGIFDEILIRLMFPVVIDLDAFPLSGFPLTQYGLARKVILIRPQADEASEQVPALPAKRKHDVSELDKQVCRSIRLAKQELVRYLRTGDAQSLGVAGWGRFEEAVYHALDTCADVPRIMLMEQQLEIAKACCPYEKAKPGYRKTRKRKTSRKKQKAKRNG